MFKTDKEPAAVKLSNLVKVMLTYMLETAWFSYLVRCTCEDEFRSGEFFENTFEGSGSLYTLCQVLFPIGDARRYAWQHRQPKSIEVEIKRSKSLFRIQSLFLFTISTADSGLIDNIQGRQYLGQTLVYNTVE